MSDVWVGVECSNTSTIETRTSPKRRRKAAVTPPRRGTNWSGTNGGPHVVEGCQKVVQTCSGRSPKKCRYSHQGLPEILSKAARTTPSHSGSVTKTRNIAGTLPNMSSERRQLVTETYRSFRNIPHNSMGHWEGAGDSDTIS